MVIISEEEKKKYEELGVLESNMEMWEEERVRLGLPDNCTLKQLNQAQSKDNIQTLIDEIDYYEDLVVEQEEIIASNHEDIKAALNLYHEFNQKVISLGQERKDIIDELSRINEKTNRLGGRISKKDQTRKEELENRLKQVEEEYNIAKENRISAKNQYDEIVATREEIKNNDELGNLKNSIGENENKLTIEYNSYVKQMEEIEKDIEERKNELQAQNEVIASIKFENYESVDEFAQVMKEETEKLASLSSALKDSIYNRNENYYHFRNIVEMIKKSGKIDDILKENNLDVTKEDSNLENPTPENLTQEDPIPTPIGTGDGQDDPDKDNNKLDLSGMSIDQLLDLYVKNNRQIELLNYKKTSILDGEFTEDNEKELDELNSKQIEIKDELIKRFALVDSLKDVSNQELAEMQKENEEKLSTLGLGDNEIRNEIEENIIKINNEINYRNKKNEIKNKMADIIDQDDITTDKVMDLDLNEPTITLDDSDKDLFNSEKLKVSLLDDIGNERAKENDNKDEKTNEIIPVPEKTNEIIPVPEKIDDNEEKEKFTVTFKNGEFDIPGYSNLEVPVGTIIHGPVIDPVPLNKKGNPKKITAKEFSGWTDENGNDIDLTKPIEKNMVLIAKYKFDVKKALAVGAGAAVGCIAFCADLAIPTPIPVVSAVGAAGFGIGSRFQGKKLKNIEQQNIEQAVTISAFDEIPEELQQEINEAKKKKNINTFLKTAAVSCTISASVQGVKNMVDSVNAAKQPVIPDNPQPNIVPNNQSVVPQPSPQPVNPVPQPVNPAPQTTQIFGGYEPTGQVFKTAQDALTNSGGLSPYKPAFAGKETFEAFFNGVRVPVSEGQSIESIVQAVGATDPSQVAINVMNADGTALTWESLADMAVEGVAKSGMVR